MADGFFSLFKPVGATMLAKSLGATTLIEFLGVTTLVESRDTATVLPFITRTGIGAAAAGAGTVVMTSNYPIISIGGVPAHRVMMSIFYPKNTDDDNDNLPPDPATVPEEYRLTGQAFLAIIKSWDVRTYNPPGTDCTSWLREIRDTCEQYGIPACQQALCAIRFMRADCNEAARAAGCYDMTWDELTLWLRQHDRTLYIPILTSAPYSQISQVRIGRVQTVPVLSFHPEDSLLTSGPQGGSRNCKRISWKYENSATSQRN